MKGIKLFACVSGLTMYMASVAAFAAMPLPFGWYIEGNAGQSRASGKTYPTPSTVYWNGFGGNFNLGYKFNPFISGEVGYTSYATTRIKNTAGGLAGQDSHYSYDFTSKVMMPIGTSGAEIFGKAGVSRLNSNVSTYSGASLNSLTFNAGTHSSTNMYYGAGADFAFTPHITANFQWDRANGSKNTGTEDLYSLGVAYII